MKDVLVTGFETLGRLSLAVLALVGAAFVVLLVAALVLLDVIAIPALAILLGLYLTGVI